MAGGVSEELIYRIRVDMEKAIADFKKVKKALEDATGKSTTAAKVGAAELSQIKKQFADRIKVARDFNKQMSADAQKRAAEETAALNAHFKQVEATGRRQQALIKQLAAEERKAASDREKQLRAQVKANEAANKAGESTITSQIAGWAKVGAAIYAAYQASKTFFDAVNKGVQFNAMLESANMAFGVMLKSMDKGAKLMGELRNLSMTTPIGLQEAAKSAKQLIAYGFGASTLVQNMKMLGTVTAATGGNLDDLAYVYGTLRTQGRAYTRDLMQFAMRGIPIYENLAAVMGVQANEVKKLTEDGKVGFAEVEKAFIRMTSEGGVYFGMLEASMQTLEGKMRVFGRTVEVALGQATQGLSGPLKSLLDSFTASIREAEPDLTALSNSLGQILEAITPLAIALSKTLTNALVIFLDSVAKALTVISPLLEIVLNVANAVLTLSKNIGLLGTALALFIGNVLLRWPVAMTAAAHGTVAFTGALGGLKFALASFIGTPAGAVLLALAGIAAIGGVITVVTATQKEYDSKIKAGLESSNPKEQAWAINESRYQDNAGVKSASVVDAFYQGIFDRLGMKGRRMTLFSDSEKYLQDTLGGKSIKSVRDIDVIATKLGKPLLDVASALYKQGQLTEKVWLNVGSYAQKAAGNSFWGQNRVAPKLIGEQDVSPLFKALADLNVNTEKYLKEVGAAPKSTQANILSKASGIAAFNAQPAITAFLEPLTAQYNTLNTLGKKIGSKEIQDNAAEAWNKAIMDSIEAVAVILQSTTDAGTIREYTEFAQGLRAKLKSTGKGGNPPDNLPDIKTTDLYQELLANATFTEMDNNALELSRAMANVTTTYTEIIDVYSKRGMVTEARQAQSDMVAAQNLLTEKYGKLATLISKREPYTIDATVKQRLVLMERANAKEIRARQETIALAQEEIAVRKGNIDRLGEQFSTRKDTIREKYNTGKIDNNVYEGAIQIVTNAYETAAKVEKDVIISQEAVIKANQDKVAALKASTDAINKELAKVGTYSPLMNANLNAVGAAGAAGSSPILANQLANQNAQYQLQVLLAEDEHQKRIAEYTKNGGEQQQILLKYENQLYELKQKNAAIEHQVAMDAARRSAMLEGDPQVLKNLMNTGLDNLYVPGADLSGVMGATTGFGQVASAQALTGSQLGASLTGANPLAQVAVAFGDAAKEVESFNKVLNWATTLMDGVFKILGPIFQAVFLPFANTIEMVGEMLGAFMAPFSAIIAAITSFSYIIGMILAGPLQALANAFLWVAKAIADYLVNPIILFANALADVMNRLFGWMGVHIKKLELLEILSAEEQAAKDKKEKAVLDALDKFKQSLSASVDYLKNKLQEQASKAVKAAQDLYEVGAITATQYEQDVNNANKYIKALEEQNVLASVKNIDKPEQIYAAILGLQQTQQAIEDKKLATAKEANAYLAAILTAITKGNSSLLPTFATGTNNVTRDMIAGVHKGEMIVPATFATAIRSGEVTLGKGSANNDGGNVYVTVNVAGSVKTENELVDAISRSIYRQRRMGAMTI